MQNQEQTANQQAFQEDNQQAIQPDVQTIELDTPIMMGTIEITSLEIRKPNVQALQGVKISDLLQGDVTAICTVLPRVCTPTLTKAQIIQMDTTDISQIGGALFLFLQPKSIRAQMLLQQ
ncbi:phage tail assembly protein [Acinetobacter sp. VNK23]|uniref:phage tail assembly protein n=1 Tax=Acinetobacter thutiue TaxID=2998078 RepID=UPI00257829E6|nr:phage tail assembly protein [Acinetobacter thutiue]MDM1022076.1 phage tail assembly protein [Acinetobacter thutiue]